MNNSLAESKITSIYKSIFDALPVAILIENIEGEIILANKAVAELIGYREDELLQKSLSYLIADESLETFRKQFSSWNYSSCNELQVYVKPKSLSPFSIMLAVSPLNIENDVAAGRIISLNIVSETNQKFDELKQQDERLRFLMNVSNEGIVLHENGIITDINNAALEMFGYKYDEVIGQSVFKFSEEREHERIKKTIRENESNNYEREIIDSNGNIRTVSVFGKTVFHNGRNVRVININDITEQKQKKTEQERLISIVERSPLFIAMMDKQGLRYLNLAGKRMMGFEPDEKINHLSIKDLMTDDSVKIINEIAIPSAIRKGSWQGQIFLVNRKNEIIPCRQTILPHRNKKNEVDYFSSIAEDISQQIRSEKILIESRERLKYFMEESLEAIIIQEGGIIIDFNTAACKMFGYAPEEMNGLSLLSLYDISFHKEIKDMILSKNIIDEEWIGVKNSGIKFDIEVYSRPHIYNGKEVRVVSILDISTRKKVERALRSSEMLLNTAVEGTNVGIWDWNLVTNEVSFNHIKDRICGYTKKTSPKFFDDWVAAIHPDDSNGFMEKLREHMQQRSPLFHAVYRIKHANGNWIFLESKGKIIRDENNLPVKCAGTSVDITERQQMENDLRQSKAQLTALIENRLESIWSVDLEKKLVSFNKSFAMVYKLLYNHDLRQGDLITTGLSDEESKTWINYYNECVNGKSLKFVEKYFINGGEVFVEFAATPIVLPDHSIVGVAVMGRDITQQIIFEESLKKSKEVAEEASKIKSQFLANISHEIRTPMNGIMGFTDLLLESKLNSQQREYLEIVRYSGDSLLNLINDLLDISKIESGKMTLFSKQFDLAKLLRDIVRSFKAKAELQQLKIISSIDISIPRNLYGDPQRLQQIYVNLLSNAVKFSSKGKILVNTKLESIDQNEVRIYSEVIDEGIGIPKEKQASIFEAFNQVSDPYTNKFGGTGLGLSICRHLVNLMGGTINISSEPGKGSKFFFTISLKTQ